MDTFIHRTNTIHDVFRYYFKHNINAFEIDVQVTKDDVIVVHHDDISKRTFASLKNIVTLEEFLKHTPDDIHINVELKTYDGRNYVRNVVDICERFKKKKIIYSSFDLLFCKQIASRSKRYAMHLHTSRDTLVDTYKNICIPQNMLSALRIKDYSSVFVYDVHIREQKKLARKYPLVQGWIVDVC